MTQRSTKEEEMALEKAWGRIGRDLWSYMAWFVKVANSDIAALSDGDIQNLQDECQAMRRIHLPFRPNEPDRKQYPFLRGGLSWSPPSRPQLQEIQMTAASHLNAIADGGDTEFGPFVITHQTKFVRSTDAERKANYRPYRIYPIELLTSPANYCCQELMIRMARFLESFVERIRRCPHCKKVFLQLRRNATYCGRGCHSVAGMQKLRAKRASERNNRTRGRRITPKRRSGHGKKHR